MQACQQSVSAYYERTRQSAAVRDNLSAATNGFAPDRCTAGLDQGTQPIRAFTCITGRFPIWSHPSSPSSEPLQLCTHWRGQGSWAARVGAATNSAWPGSESCESAQLSQSACFAGVRALGRAQSRDMQAVTHSCKLVQMVAQSKSCLYDQSPRALHNHIYTRQQKVGTWFT